MLLGPIRRCLEEEDARDTAWHRLEAMLETLPATGQMSDRFDRQETYSERAGKYDRTRRHKPSGLCCWHSPRPLIWCGGRAGRTLASF